MRLFATQDMARLARGAGSPSLKFIQMFGMGAAALVILAAGSSQASATALPITDNGILQLSNLQGTLVGVTSVPPCINWGGGTTCTPGTMHQDAVSGSSNLFSIAASTTDEIQDITTYANVTDFETVLGAGAVAGQTINFNLVQLVTAGSTVGNCASNAANNQCEIAGSPFLITENSLGNGVSITLTTTLDAYTGTFASGDTAYNGTFTTQLSGTIVGTGACGGGIAASITNIEGCEANGGTIQATWSATESPAPAPEPGTFGMLLGGAGLIGLSAARRRRAS